MQRRKNKPAGATDVGGLTSLTSFGAAQGRDNLNNANPLKSDYRASCPDWLAMRCFGFASTGSTAPTGAGGGTGGGLTTGGTTVHFGGNIRH
jgi:hypothetical protein